MIWKKVKVSNEGCYNDNNKSKPSSIVVLSKDFIETKPNG